MLFIHLKITLPIVGGNPPPQYQISEDRALTSRITALRKKSLNAKIDERDGTIVPLPIGYTSHDWSAMIKRSAQVIYK
jgi:hypothetical protein